MNPYSRPPGSSRCPHGDYYFEKISPTYTKMYCRLCKELAGEYVEQQATPIKRVSGKPTELTDKEIEELR